jgi:hypothetical protein
MYDWHGLAAAQRLAVQLPAPGYSFDKSVLVVKMRAISSSAASGAGQLQRLVGRQHEIGLHGTDTSLSQMLSVSVSVSIHRSCLAST